MRRDPATALLRAAYSAALYLLLPVTLYHLVWRGFRQRGYLVRWDERYARYTQSRAGAGRALWVHAVSVGEVNAAVPLVNALLKRYAGTPLVITTITPTGSERVRALWGERVEHVYLPYDLPGAVGRFLDRFNPTCALLMETELWPNLLFACGVRGVPVAVVNARLSARSLNAYRVLAPLIARALRHLTRVCAQTAADGERFRRLGAPAHAVVETGNLKYDVSQPDGLKAFIADFRRHAGARPVWIAASTHPMEEWQVLEAHRLLRQAQPDALMLWAPRHPERFRAAVEHARSLGFRTHARTRHAWPAREDAVFVIDTLGELGHFYGCADIAFVGGSLQDIGGHNLLEPAIVARPVLTGPSLHNFADIAQQLTTVGAVRIIEDATGLARQLIAWGSDPPARAQAGTAGHALVVAGRGALERTWLALAGCVLPPEPQSG